MNANELMIGDWVGVEGFQVDDDGKNPVYQLLKRQVQGLRKGVVTIDCYEFYPGLCMPIPLTPEILEKNGFECTRGGKFAGVFNVADRYECTIKNERGGTEWWIDIQDLGEREETFWMIHIQGHRNVSGYWGYVHELQHALRLAGINKEIVL